VASVVGQIAQALLLGRLTAATEAAVKAARDGDFAEADRCIAEAGGWLRRLRDASQLKESGRG
jgi:hypothetical protein